MFYSEAFNCNAVVVYFKNENDWYFVLEDYPVVLKAQIKPENVKWIGIQKENKGEV